MAPYILVVALEGGMLMDNFGVTAVRGDENWSKEAMNDTFAEEDLYSPAEHALELPDTLESSM